MPAVPPPPSMPPVPAVQPKAASALADRQVWSRLKLRQLRFIVALDDHRKLQNAAAELAVSQPAASKMLGEIEALVGVPLFQRLPRGVEPTWYGEVLVRRARAMLAELAQATHEIEALKAGDGGSVAIGTVMAPAVEAVFEAVKSVRAESPLLRVSVEVETSDVLVERLLASRLDFVVARIPGGSNILGLDYREGRREDCCLMVRRAHPLAGLATVTPADLVGRDWVLQPRGSLLRRSVETMLRRNGLPLPDRVLDTGALLMTIVMVARTDAIAPLAVPVADLLLGASGEFTVLNLSEKLSVEPYGLIALRGRVLSPAARVLYDAVGRRLGSG